MINQLNENGYANVTLNKKREGIFWVCRSKDEIVNRLNLGRAISGVFIDKPKFHEKIIAVFGTGKKTVGLAVLKIHKNERKDKIMGLHFCKLTLEDHEQSPEATYNALQELSGIGALALPLKKMNSNSNDSFQQQFTVIYSNWMVLGQNGEINMPRVDKSLFCLEDV